MTGDYNDDDDDDDDDGARYISVGNWTVNCLISTDSFVTVFCCSPSRVKSHVEDVHNIIFNISTAFFCVFFILNFLLLCLFNGRFQDNLGRLVPECQTVLGYTAARDDGGDSVNNWNWTLLLLLLLLCVSKMSARFSSITWSSLNQSPNSLAYNILKVVASKCVHNFPPRLCFVVTLPGALTFYLKCAPYKSTYLLTKNTLATE